MLFWKETWLRRVDPIQVPAITVDQSAQQLLSISRAKTFASGRYFCQSTELINATRAMTRLRKVLKCLVDVYAGNRGILEMAWLVLWPLWRKATRRFPRRRLIGNLKRTPVGHLKLQSGEKVGIRTESEIAQTLDARGRNRGLLCDLGMSRYAGGTYQVRNRLDRMISEPTGEMRHVEGTVILDGLYCECWDTAGGCPRGEFMYWREIWLKRSEERSIP